ncbi:M15 family metallopeptidase [Sinorhizobium meliloti]|uniref:M15 family metallopeptidase n=1 Tax=Rhizobium meliloti TaxID=382 RepID=UPI00138ABFD6|nr:M15 family metallopeptidase [Sinorhizobium meliloti]
MPFRLSRGGPNVIAEVQRWQYFLLRIGIHQAGLIDGDFGMKTELATKFFQVQSGLTSNGKVNDQTLQKAQELGYTILPDDYYSAREGNSFPPEPNNLESPSNASRNAVFTCFKFRQRPRAQRPDAEAIVIKGSCDGSLSDWTAAKIIEIPMPQLKFARGFNGRVRCHKLAAPIIAQLFEAWERAELLHLIMSYEGCFVPRYKRNQAPPGAGGHGERKSADVSALSNHSFGSAFDINFSDNMLGQVPAFCGRRGSTRELVDAANELGVFWGGHFSTQDGMHFEISRVS